MLQYNITEIQPHNMTYRVDSRDPYVWDVALLVFYPRLLRQESPNSSTRQSLINLTSKLNFVKSCIGLDIPHDADMYVHTRVHVVWSVVSYYTCVAIISSSIKTMNGLCRDSKNRGSRRTSAWHKKRYPRFLKCFCFGFPSIRLHESLQRFLLSRSKTRL